MVGVPILPVFAMRRVGLTECLHFDPDRWFCRLVYYARASCQRKRRQERANRPQQVVEDYRFGNMSIAPALQSLGFISRHCESGYSDDWNARLIPLSQVDQYLGL